MQFVKSGSIRLLRFHNKEECIGCIIEVTDCYITLITCNGEVRAARMDAIKDVILGNFEDGLRRKLMKAYTCYKELEELKNKCVGLQNIADKAKRAQDIKEKEFNGILDEMR